MQTLRFIRPHRPDFAERMRELLEDLTSRSTSPSSIRAIIAVLLCSAALLGVSRITCGADSHAADAGSHSSVLPPVLSGLHVGPEQVAAAAS